MAGFPERRQSVDEAVQTVTVSPAQREFLAIVQHHEVLAVTAGLQSANPIYIDNQRAMNPKELVNALGRAADSDAADNEPRRDADTEAEFLRERLSLLVMNMISI